ncbi:MAG: hypothetical protein CMA72_01990 [Euryarchaeota archaeon]|nr:hypothetical protein [Euryarchaeota archaeon]
MVALIAIMFSLICGDANRIGYSVAWDAFTTRFNDSSASRTFHVLPHWHRITLESTFTSNALAVIRVHRTSG